MQNMFSLEETLEIACSKRSIPNAIVHAADRKGESLDKITPRTLLKKAVDDKAVQDISTMRLLSACTPLSQASH